MLKPKLGAHKMTKQLGASVLADMLEAYGVTHVFFPPSCHEKDVAGD